MSEKTHSETTNTVRETLSRNIVSDIAARVGYLVSRFFIPPFVLAHMGLEAYGLWSTAFILVAYIGISTMGISNVNIKYVAEYAAREEHQKANSLLSTGLMFTLPLSLLAFLATWLFWRNIVVWLKVSPALRDDAREVVLAVVAIFLSSIVFSLFRDALVGVQAGSATQTIWVVAYTVETILIFVLVGMGRGVRGLAEAFLVRTLIEIVLSAVLAFRRIPWLRISWRYGSREALRNLMHYGGVVQLSSLFAIVLGSIERAVAAPLVGLEASGLLDIAKKLPGMAASIPSAFASSLLPAASYLQGGTGEEGKEAIRKLYLKGARYMVLSTAYFCALMACMPLPMLTAWLGKVYPGAALLMTVFSVSLQFHLLTGPGTSMLKGLGKPKLEFHYCIPNAILLLVAIPLSWIPTHSFTALNLGIAVAISTVLSALWFLYQADKAMFVPHSVFFRRVLLAGFAPYPVAALCAIPVWLVMGSVSRWTLFGVISAAGLVYTLLCILAIYRLVLDEGERLWFAAVIRQRLGRLLPA